MPASNAPVLPAMLEWAIAAPGLEGLLEAPERVAYLLDHLGAPTLVLASLRNTGEQPFEALSLEVSLGEHRQTIFLGRLAPGAALEPDFVLPYRLEAERLREIEAPRPAAWDFSLRDGERELASGRLQASLEPYAHWLAATTGAESLAAFVQPGHPVVFALLQALRERLHAETGSDAILGYQGEATRVRAQVSALHEALQERGWGYVGAPPGFGRVGQAVRLPEAIAAEGQACCLDIALLAAACLRQMGLNPLVILSEGHATLGVWLHERRRLDGGLCADAATLQAHLAAGDLLLWDATLALGRPAHPFAAAEAHARPELAKLEVALDLEVLAARIPPLPLRARAGAAPEAEGAGPEPLTVTLRREQDLHTLARPALGHRIPPAARRRFLRWQERLLDLSLRNRLLKLPSRGHKVLRLAVGDLDLFENLLAAQQRLELAPLAEAEAPEAPPAAYLQERLARQRLVSVAGFGAEAPLEAALKRLERETRLELEESGVHTLYVGVGLLAWRETGAAEPHLAPLLLVPVGLKLDRVRRVFALQATGGEVLPNVTLVEKLRRDHGVELGALLAPEADEAGLDTAGLLREVARAVAGKPGWTVLPEAVLGAFSFAKFVMWQDLAHNAEALLQSPVVAHLASQATERFAQDADGVSPEALEPAWAQAPWPCVVPADSSQLSAIASALAGRSFVLQGPPGTGKSQTITALIAALLGAGKRVLFVSEKMAALDVVQRRLESAGLGAFCLELHSPKTNKLSVLQALQAAYERPRGASGEPFAQQAPLVAAGQAALSGLARALHAPRPGGASARELADRLVALESAPDLALGAGVSGWDARALAEAREAVAAWAALAERVEPAGAHPWAGTRPGAYSARREAEIAQALEALEAAALAARRAASALARETGAPAPEGPAPLASWAGRWAALAEGPLPPAAFDPAGWPAFEARARRLLAEGRAQEARRAALLARARPSALAVDWAPTLEAVRRGRGAPRLFQLFTLWGPRGRLKPYVLGAPLAGAALLDWLELAVAHREAEAPLRAERGALEAAFGPARLEAPELAEAALARGARFVPLASELLAGGQNPDTLRALGASPQARQAIAGAAEALRAAVEAYARAEGAALALLGLASGAPSLALALERARSLQAARSAFRSWALYREAAGELERMGLAPLAAAHAEGRLGARELVPAFEKAASKQILAAVAEGEPALGHFDATAAEAQAERYRALTEKLAQAAREQVISRLEAALPAPGIAIEGTEPGVLARELRRQRGHMPIRKLLSSIPTLVSRLKPCFLMSPLSIAQYLPADGEPFDVVVFDEASQIGTHDAIGALARGKQVVIVGDSRQLPPTAFFQRASAEDEDGAGDEDGVVELESVLEEALAAQLPEQRLSWHYRSRHEALIDFSNRHYYDAGLTVFPTASRHSEDLGVRYHAVPGVYGASGERTNPVEAAALVSHLVERLKRFRPGARSFGVVTFSMAQQQLILDLLDQARARSPEIEGHFDPAYDERVFVKNLENVQGDERDEIAFSIGYAPDAQGKLRLHFGPLSLRGGERRLNVAVTRARCLLRVFSSLDPERIDLKRTSAMGAAHLKAFLRFARSQEAQRQAPGLAEAQAPGLELDVRRALEARGCTVVPELGAGAYRVALAVSAPNEPERFVLAVETDGRHFASGATARDREVVRPGMLAALGWKTHRVWSLGWLQDPAGETERLLASLEAASAPPEPKADAVPEAEAPAPEVPAMPLPAGEPEAAHRGLAEAPSRLAEPAPYRLAEPAPYVRAELPPLAQDWQSLEATPALDALLTTLLTQEGPLTPEWLLKRLQPAAGVDRLTPAFKRRIQERLEALGHAPRAGCYGPPATTFRGADAEGRFRDPEHLPVEEVALAMEALTRALLAVEREALFKETARRFGASRLGKAMSAVCEAALEALVAEGRIEAQGDRLRAKAPEATP